MFSIRDFIVNHITQPSHKSPITQFRESVWSRLLLFVLIAHFANLSANFYEGNISPTDQVTLADPLDSVSELLIEWALDAPPDTIPDNGTHQDDNGIEKIKLATTDIPSFSLQVAVFSPSDACLGYADGLAQAHTSSPSPPPYYC